MLGMVDTEHYGYGELYNEINMNTGGITPGIKRISPMSRIRPWCGRDWGIQVRTLEDKIGYSFRMIEEILFSSTWDRKNGCRKLSRSWNPGFRPS